jgi:hypothetical protein
MIKKMFVPMFAAVLILSACGGLQQSSAGSAAERSISVVGSAQIPVTPDVAYISIGVHTEDVEVAVAVETNKEQIERVTEALRSFGVADADIQTTNFNLYTADQYDLEGQKTGTRYVVDNTVYVTFRETESLGEILDQVIVSGANSIYGISFDLADRTAINQEAREMALEDARTQAEALAGYAGVTLGEIHSITFTGGAFPATFYGSQGYYGLGGGGGEGAVPVSYGQLMVTAQVNVVYQIGD